MTFAPRLIDTSRQIAHHAASRPEIQPINANRSPIIASAARPHFAGRQDIGATMLESVVCLTLLIISGLTAIELYQWNLARAQAQVALSIVSRAGAVAHADPTLMHEVVSTELRGLSGLRQLRGWKIETLSPTGEMFHDFADSRLTKLHGVPTIRNEFLAEQHNKHRNRGWRDGIGPRSGKTIFDANTLRLRLSVLHRPSVPGVAAILRLLPPTGDLWKSAAHGQGLLVIVVESTAAMHSHPVSGTHLKNAPYAVPVSQLPEPASNRSGYPANTPTDPGIVLAAPVAGQGPHIAIDERATPLPWNSAPRDLCGTLLCCPETSKLLAIERPRQ